MIPEETSDDESDDEDVDCGVSTLRSLIDVEKPKPKSAKKKRSVKDPKDPKDPKEHSASTTVELGDTQSIAFIDGYEYVTNIVNDGIIPKEVLHQHAELLAVRNDIKSNVTLPKGIERRRSTAGLR